MNSEKKHKIYIKFLQKYTDHGIIDFLKSVRQKIVVVYEF